MDQQSTNLSYVTWILGGIALGAAAMYMFDPVQGNRRRALARDKVYSSRVQLRKSINAKSHDLANRAKGLRAEARHILPKKDSQTSTQEPMIEV